nr:aldehyde dehydrogenase EutE [Cerasicoccus maritimus]
MSLQIDEAVLKGVVADVLRKLQEQASGSPVADSKKEDCGCSCDGACSRGELGVFQNATDAAAAAKEAQKKLRKLGIEGRDKVVKIVKATCAEKAVEWGELEFAETKIGRLEHKIAKLQGIPNLPGVEWLAPRGMSGDHGITMEENTPFGVIGAITPVTHSIPTLSCNIVSMVAAGNTVVFNAHPGGAKCAVAAVREYNKRFKAELGIENIATIIEKPSLDSFNELCATPDVNLLCVTGGPGVVNAAMKSGKRAICAGPGNPPVVVDDSADLDKAAGDIIMGAAFDNNLLCIGEKQIFVVDKVYDQFIAALKKAGAFQLNAAQLDRLTKVAFTFKGDGGGCSHPVVNRDLVGADATKLAEIAGTSAPADTQMLFAETDEGHLFVIEEQMMPMVPVIRARDIDHAIEMAVKSEHGYKHSGMIHTLNVVNMGKMARALDTTLFVKNGACVAGLGMGGEGYSSFSIATTTGEGITTPDTFTRRRRCVLVDNLQMY